jgi:hypothetical protein
MNFAFFFTAEDAEVRRGLPTVPLRQVADRIAGHILIPFILG